MNQSKTSKPTLPAAEQQEAAPSDWGLDAPKKRGGSETRIALLLVVSLIGALGYVTYRKLDERRKAPHSGDFQQPAVTAATENGLEPSAPGEQNEPAPGTEFSWAAGPGDAATALEPSDSIAMPDESGDFWSSPPEQQDPEGGAPRTFADDRAAEFLTAQAASDEPPGETQSANADTAWDPFASETPLESPAAEQPTTDNDAVTTQASNLSDSAQPFAAIPAAESGFPENQVTWSSDLQDPAGADAASRAQNGEPESVAVLPPVSETESEPVMDLFGTEPAAEPDAPGLSGDSTADQPANGPLLEPLRVPADDARVMPVASEAAAHDVAPINETDAAGNNPWESAEPRALAQNTGRPVPEIDFSESAASTNVAADGATPNSGFLPEADQAAAATGSWDSGPAGPQAPTATGADPFAPGVAESASASGSGQLRVHTVQSGDNFWTIAHKHYQAGRFANALAAFNQSRIPDPRKMRPGMKVLIPDRQVLIERFPKLTGAAYGPAPAAAPARAGFFVDRSGQPCYRVGKNDTLTAIAARHLGRSSRWVQVLGMNRDQLRDAGNLKVGMVLKLPLDATQVSVVTESTAAR